jgi:hypothetical protein
MPGMNSIGWTSFEQMMSDALALLGEGRIKIELTPEQRNAIMRRVLVWYGAVKAPKRLMWPGATGNNVFEMSEDCDVILEVATSPLADSLFDIYSGGVGYSIIYDPLPIAMFRGDFSYVLQILQDVEMGQKIMSADVTWEYDRVTRLLRVYPGNLNPSRVAVFYLSARLDFKDVELMDQDLLFRRLQAEGKQTIGLMRRKYSEWPGPGGMVTMDGDALVMEASEEKVALDEELMGKARPCGFMVG